MKAFFTNICDEYAKTKRFSGTCLVKQGDVEIFAGAYGYANRAFKIKNQIDTKFDTASVTKTFTAVAILQLVEKGLLNLDDYVTKNIFEKANMNDTKFCAMDEINENAAEGYVNIWKETEKDKWEHAGFKKNIYSYPPIGTADSGAYTTVGDLDKFIKAINHHVLLSQKYSDMLFSPHCKLTKASPWTEVKNTKVRTGYAFEFLEIDDIPFCIFKEGVNDGVDVMFSYYPKADITLSILANQNYDIEEMFDAMQTEIYRKFYVISINNGYTQRSR